MTSPPGTRSAITNRNDGQVKIKNQAGRYEVIPGMSAADFGDGGAEDPPAGVGQLDDGKFTVNVDQASLPESAKLILGETLGYNYTDRPARAGHRDPGQQSISHRPRTAQRL